MSIVGVIVFFLFLGLRPLRGLNRVSLVTPSTGWMLYYLCFTPSTAIGPLCDRECDWEAPISPYLASKHRWESSTASFSTACRAQPRDGCAIVSQTPLKQARKKNAIEATILNCILERLNSQPQGATKRVRQTVRELPKTQTLRNKGPFFAAISSSSWFSGIRLLSLPNLPKRRQFHVWRRNATISVSKGALRKRTVSRRNLCDAESLAKPLQRNWSLRSCWVSSLWECHK